MLSFSLLMIFTTAFSQNISDYRSIYIPKEFADAKANKYGLKDVLKSKLKAKKFVIVENAAEFSCEMLKAEVSDTSNFIKNKVQLSFKDCNDKVIANYEGKSSIKEFEPGMKEALQFALNNVAVSAPKSVATTILKDKSQPISQRNAETNATKLELENEAIAESKAESFSNGTFTFNKITISQNQFILANPNNSVPFAIFKTSTKKMFTTFNWKMEATLWVIGKTEKS
ncbi:hypothetical protein LDL59_12985 [Kaistella anthropi]|nr:hypothetical protein [Kaistella anthropi]